MYQVKMYTVLKHVYMYIHRNDTVRNDKVFTTMRTFVLLRSAIERRVYFYSANKIEADNLLWPPNK